MMPVGLLMKEDRLSERMIRAMNAKPENIKKRIRLVLCLLIKL